MIAAFEENIIKNWINEVITQGTWPDHDLHIDRINPSLKQKPSIWIDKAAEYFRYAFFLANQNDFQAILAIGLKSKGHFGSIENIRLESLDAGELSHSPPSLYLYKKDHETYKTIAHMINEQGLQYKEFRYALYQFKDETDGTYNSSFLIEGNG